MRYLILIQSNEHSREVWEGLSDDQRAAFGRAHLALTEELRGTGELVASEGLPDPSTATSVRVRGGRTLTSDGPFAARAPDAETGSVEVRPVYDMSQLDL
jgi:hypothetical protein